MEEDDDELLAGVRARKRRRRGAESAREGDDAAHAAAARAEPEGKEMFDEMVRLEPLFATMTPAQRRHYLHKRRLEARQNKSLASLTHRDRVDALNRYLSSLPVHNDIPKVAMAGLG